MLITYQRQKLINAILYFAQHTKYCGKTKLLKLLYFLDFSHFKMTGRSVTGLNYSAWRLGPVPQELFKELSGKMQPDLKSAIHDLPKCQVQDQPKQPIQLIRARRNFDGQYFSNNELKLLEEIAFIFKDATAEQMVESTHLKNQPWDLTLHQKGEFKEIDYMLAVDGVGGSLTINEVRERVEERIEMHKIFGVG